MPVLLYIIAVACLLGGIIIATNTWPDTSGFRQIPAQSYILPVSALVAGFVQATFIAAFGYLIENVEQLRQHFVPQRPSSSVATTSTNSKQQGKATAPEDPYPEQGEPIETVKMGAWRVSKYRGVQYGRVEEAVAQKRKDVEDQLSH